VQTRQRLIKSRVEVPQAGARLVSHLGTGGAAAIGQPKAGDLALQSGWIRGGQAVDLGVGPVAQDFSQALELGEQRAALGLGRVRGENQVNGNLVDELLHGGGIDSALFQFEYTGLNRFANRQAIRRLGIGAQACSAAAAQQQNAEVFLGYVHQLKVEREGHRLVEGLAWGQARDGLAEGWGGGEIAGARGLG
jgi:hypothetical protein